MADRLLVDPAMILHADCYAPLVEAAAQGAIGIGLAMPGFPIAARDLQAEARRRPVVVLIGARGETPTRPGDFPELAALLRWAGWAMIYGAEGRAEDYARALTMAQAMRRIVIIETTARRHRGWLAFAESSAPKTPVVAITAPAAERRVLH